MEGDNFGCVKTPLLSCDTNEEHEESNIIGNEISLQKSNSVTSLKSDFFSKLPEKLRSGLDPEALLNLDLTKTTGLIEGKSHINIFCFYKNRLFARKSFSIANFHNETTIDKIDVRCILI